MAQVKAKHVILITIGLILLTFALYTPAYAWLEDTLTPAAVVVADTGVPRLYQLDHAWDGKDKLAPIVSTSSASPSPVKPAQAGNLYLMVCDTPKDGSGINTVTATTTGGTPTSLTFARSTDYTWYPRPDETDASCWKAAFTTPAEGTSFSITLTVKDKAGNTATKTLYAKACTPNGEFYINEQKVTMESTIYINTLTMNIKFKATELGSVMEIVRVAVYNKDETVKHTEFNLTETTADTEWTGTYTLPASGTYVVKGWFFFYGTPYQKMSLGIDTGATPVPPQTYYRFFLGLLGIIFIAYPIYDVYAEKPKL